MINNKKHTIFWIDGSNESSLSNDQTVFDVVFVQVYLKVKSSE
jgi:hypothetical protein